mmetsp:Transcript_22233/g.66742  ORF Transcript_22233/g.66742 Transcript_22233/m.66742 type:complete len:164 (-) Transcript_22233:510-1001(-)
MRAAFERLGKPLVFSGECGCWPQVQRDHGVTCRDAYPPSPTPYRYLNSGSWIGRAHVAARFLRLIIARAGKTGSALHKLNDQELASELYATAVPDCDPWLDLREVGGVYHNTRTGSRPAVFHYNGGGKRRPVSASTVSTDLARFQTGRRFLGSTVKKRPDSSV